MEPGGLRESPAGSGASEPGEWSEEVRGGEAEVKTGLGEGEVTEESDFKQKEQTPIHYEEELDPRIQDELEQLNEASAEINKLELQLDEARSGYRRILTESARKLNAHSSQLGGAIEKARPYYEARRLAKEAQQETQKAALSYERAVSMHSAAREMVYVAEQGLMADGKNTLDPTWQEMLNHATSKVNEAEEERLRSEREHLGVTHACQLAEARVQSLQKSLKRAIVKSRPYFELKTQFNYILEEHKGRVLQLEHSVSKVKSQYSVALNNLEKISEQIHAQRGRGVAVGGPITACGGRSSPVGAEADGGGAGGGAGGGSDLLAACREREEERARERAGSDSASVFSLQTIVSDLGKVDSVEHLGEMSDGGSMTDGGSAAGDADREEAPSRTLAKQRQQHFSKQHHRSFSL
ncbi:SH3-binding domain protein 5-like, a [Gadus macrocephalus]|uniref:SH3-binding domain protein 5-like, a n=1 Tax=Gadus macrocephalus TaxID=80720 RepID=UPI0028CB8D78|nr:SH3-binding domain protein 5-like, a [Gadus macrocephalus]